METNSERLNGMLHALDITPYIGSDARRLIAALLDEEGRHHEAHILRTCRMYAIRELSCGHLHIREIGQQFIGLVRLECQEAEVLD